MIAPFRDDVNAFGDGSASMGDIKWEKFTADAGVEFHGCNAANPLDPHLPSAIASAGKDLIVCKTVSELLEKAGKTDAFVIGDATQSSPNMPGTKTQDYSTARESSTTTARS